MEPEHLDCRVVWYPRGGGGEPVVVTGDFVNAWETPTLACGLGEIVDALGHVLTATTYARVQRLVNEQLSQRPWAEITCPTGTARLELMM